MRLRPKLLFMTLLTAGLPLLAGVFLMNRLGSQHITGQEGKRLQLSAKYLSTALEVMLHEYVNDMKHWCEEPELPETLGTITSKFQQAHAFREWPTDEIEAIWPSLEVGDARLDFFLTNRVANSINRWQALNPQFQEVLATDARGGLMAASNKSSDFWQADEAWWREGAALGQKEAYVEGIQYDESAGVYSLDVMSSIVSDSRLRGVVKGVLDAGPLISAMNSLSYGATYDVEIVLPGGEVLAHLHDSKYIPMSASVPDDVNEQIHGNVRGWFLRGRGTEREFCAYAGVRLGGRTQKGVEVKSSQPFTLVVRRSSSEALGALTSQVRNITLAATVLIGLLLLLVDQVVLRYVARPIQRLRTATGRLNWTSSSPSTDTTWLDDLAQQVHGDLDLIQSEDEVRELSRDFGSMTDRIIQNERESLLRQKGLEGDLEARSTEIREVSGQLDESERDLAAAVRELELKNKDLEAFAYIASHDLKAPLRAVGSIAAWLQSDYADRLDEPGQEMLTLLGKRVERMDRLIDGVLAYSRAGNVGDLVPVEVAEVLDDVLFQLNCPEGIVIERKGSFPRMVTSRVGFGQVLQNLIGNAIKYMDKPDGHIEVAARRDGDLWEFRVSDNGPGIDPKYHEKIFKIFSTLHSRDEIDSTGVGLTVVKRLIEALGGKVWAEDTPGGGTTFKFTHPASEP